MRPRFGAWKKEAPHPELKIRGTMESYCVPSFVFGTVHASFKLVFMTIHCCKLYERRD